MWKKSLIMSILVLLVFTCIYFDKQKVNAISQLFQVNSDKKVQIVAGVLRNTGSGWRFISDTGHSSVGISEVSNDHSSITVKFNFPVKNVISFVATPDEKMSQDKMFLGATVSLTQANIYVYQNKSIQSYIYYNGTNWTCSGDEVMTVTFNKGELTVNHPMITGTQVTASVRGGTYLIDPASVSPTQTVFDIRNYSGQLITTPNSNMRIFFSRTSSGSTVNLDNYISPDANIWIMGVMEAQ